LWFSFGCVEFLAGVVASLVAPWTVPKVPQPFATSLCAYTPYSDGTGRIPSCANFLLKIFLVAHRRLVLYPESEVLYSISVLSGGLVWGGRYDAKDRQIKKVGYKEEDGEGNSGTKDARLVSNSEAARQGHPLRRPVNGGCRYGFKVRARLPALRRWPGGHNVKPPQYDQDDDQPPQGPCRFNEGDHGFTSFMSLFNLQFI